MASAIALAAFQASVKKAAELANQDKLVAFGIFGNSPETGDGYIKRGEAVGHSYVVESFC